MPVLCHSLATMTVYRQRGARSMLPALHAVGGFLPGVVPYGDARPQNG